MFDEELLARLDERPEVAADGRSAVLREAVREYLARRAKAEIADAYRAAYSGGEGLGDEFAGWEDQGEWPAA